MIAVPRDPAAGPVDRGTTSAGTEEASTWDQESVMKRAVSFLFAVVALAPAVAACAGQSAEGGGAAVAPAEGEGPPRPRLTAATNGPGEQSPHPVLASLAKDPASPTDPAASSHPRCAADMVI